ncbi:MAG: hypothetical protein IT578_09435 [Verrucomicrobiae bacterium]|nr:hypothetical protein [Verrucomicrobiae bacterium]
MIKAWLLFGVGMCLGIFFGAVGAGFFLYDDVTHPAASFSKATATVSRPAARLRPAAVPPVEAVTTVEARPTAISAQAVDLSALSDVEAGVISTVRQDVPLRAVPPAP